MMVSQIIIGIAVGTVMVAASLYLTYQVYKILIQQQKLIAEKLKLELKVHELEGKIESLDSNHMEFCQGLVNLEEKLDSSIERQKELSQLDSESLFRAQADKILKGQQISDLTDPAPSRSEVKLMALVGKTEAGDN